MLDVTNTIEAGDTRLKAKGSRLTRTDLVNNKIDIMSKHLNTSKSIITTVYEKDELVERTKGEISNTKEVADYYAETFELGLSFSQERNEVIIRLNRPLNKEIILDDEDL